MSISDKEFYQLSISISKALHGIETPLKTKHARAAIIGTFYTHGAHAFWSIALRQPLQENRITAWKFCHLLHKVLREGHHLSCQQSMRHRSMLLEMGRLWGHLNDGYGLSIRHYTKLLIGKLEFHDRNPRIPGNLTLKRGELETITGNDVNFYFQMAVEMFDYLDDVIALQATIFSSLTTFHVNSMTSAGQCRLAPLIPLIQDSNQLYDFLVRIMFKLHGNLPNDVLQGHRDRFRAIFTQLKSFYGQSRNLQYFVNLITVPKLPESAPNFGSQVDFGSYTAPVVVVPEPDPEPEPEPMVNNLVDMSDFQAEQQQMQQQHYQHQQQQQPNHSNGSSTTDGPKSATTEAQLIDLKRIVQDRDELIRHLQMEVDRLGKCMKSLTIQTRDDQAGLEQQVASLNSQLSDAHESLTNLRFVKEELELKAQSSEKQFVEEERHKASEEKFQKIKVMYASIRDEHVKLLRQHGEVSKQLATATQVTSEATKSRDEALQKLEDVRINQSRVEEQLQQSSESTNNERFELEKRVEELEIENSALSAKLDDVTLRKETEVEELQRKVIEFEERVPALEETVASKHIEIVMLAKNVEQFQQSSESTNNERFELGQRVEELENENSTLSAKLDEVTASKEAAIEDLQRQVIEFEERVPALEETVASKGVEITRLEESIEELVQKHQLLLSNIDRAFEERTTLESDMQDLLLEQETLNEQFIASAAHQRTLEDELRDLRISQETVQRALIQTCIRSAENLTTRAVAENDVAAANGTSSYFRMIAEDLQSVLNELVLVNAAYTNDPDNNGEGMVRKIVLAGHLLASVHAQGMSVGNTASDIEIGERITDEIKAWSQTVNTLFASLHSAAKPSEVTAEIDEVREKLQNITTMIHDLSKNADGTEIIADIIESELSSMDKAIEEAAISIENLLSQSRASDSGIKLEVNEKILDACTALMNNIRILVQKSRALQAEIVALGKGSASAKEFYKRNHQWTEGLISAAKNIAQGANFLVAAANKAITGESKDQLDLIVAAQEIAACTAQLVVSSRVKAPRGSPHLEALGKASRDVTQATGGVVATVKDSHQRLEDSQDLDLGNLSVHQAKTLEMEIQVKVLELEQALQMERHRLAAFRRKNYRES